MRSTAASAAAPLIRHTTLPPDRVRKTTLPTDSTAADSISANGTNRLRSRPEIKTPSTPTDVSCGLKTKMRRAQRNSSPAGGGIARPTDGRPTRSGRARIAGPPSPPIGHGHRPMNRGKSDDGLRRIAGQRTEQRDGLLVAPRLELGVGINAAVEVDANAVEALLESSPTGWSCARRRPCPRRERRRRPREARTWRTPASSPSNARKTPVPPRPMSHIKRASPCRRPDVAQAITATAIPASRRTCERRSSIASTRLSLTPQA